MKPLISVIVPVYNVEQYLGACLDSILAQTYENLEILLLDDGSRDKSGGICDEYAGKDSRIQVVHKKNTGQADTRNTGIDMAAGDFILFVDSDDIVSADYVERLWQIVEETGAGMAACGFRPFHDREEKMVKREAGRRQEQRHGGGHDSGCDSGRSVRVMSSEEGLSSLFYKKEITASPCYRIFRREVFRQLRFEKGRIFEDLGLMYLAVEAAGKVAWTPQVMYWYRQREGSTMHQEHFGARRMDRIYFSEKILDFAENSHPALLPAARARYFVSCYLVLSELPGEKEYKETYQMLKTGIRNFAKDVAGDRNAPAKTRLMAALACISVPAVRLAGRFLRRHTSQS